jgi:hypothetical protein
MQSPSFVACAAVLLAAASAPLQAAPQQQTGNQFNPKISLILNTTFADYSNKTAADVPGFLLGDETDFAPSGISLGETELAAEANIDDRVHGWAVLSVAPDGGIGVEEAFVNTLALPYGFAAKLGRFFSDIGYMNHQHAHAWEFADAPLVYRAMLANQLDDDGLQLRWVAPADLLIELGGEAYRGDGFPAGGPDRSGVKNFTGFLHVGGDLGPSHAWRLGLWHVRSDANGRDTADLDPALADTSFTGKSDLSGADLIWKWAPDGNPSVHNFVGQAEYFFRREHGDLVYDPAGTADASTYRGDQQGFYVQGVYQFMPRWRAGVRYDRLRTGNTLSNPAVGTALATLADNSHAPQRYSGMVDFSNSEFSRVRLQYNRDQSRPGGATDNQWLVQFIFSMGSHPAHQF